MDAGYQLLINDNIYFNDIYIPEFYSYYRFFNIFTILEFEKKNSLFISYFFLFLFVFGTCSGIFLCVMKDNFKKNINYDNNVNYDKIKTLTI